MNWPHGASRHFLEALQHWDGLCCVCEEWDYFKNVGSAGSVIASQSSIFRAWVCAAYTAEWHQASQNKVLRCKVPQDSTEGYMGQREPILHT